MRLVGVADGMSFFSAAKTTSAAGYSSDWLSAEEEKKRLYEKAQATAKKTQARALTSGPGMETAPASASKDIVNPFTNAPAPSISSGVELYQSAMKSVKSPLTVPVAASSPPRVQSPPMGPPQTSSPQYTHVSEYSTSGSGTSSGSHPPPPVASASAFPSAEEEKTRLRYEEAKRAVERHQATIGEPSSSGYDASWEPSPPAQPYSSSPSTQGYASPQGVTNGLQLARQPSIRTPGSPPPFSPPIMGYSAASDLPEKEKIKLAFARRDAMLEQQQASEPPPPDYGGSPRGEPLATFSSPPPPPSASFIPLSAAEEKARLKAQYEAEETVDAAGGSGMRSPPPEPPSYAGDTRPLTAVEERALLQARMAAEQPVGVSPPAPPPRLKSPAPASGSPRPPYLAHQSTGSSASDIAPRDPSISAGKQRAASNTHLPSLGGLGRVPSVTVTPQPTALPKMVPPPPPPLAPRPPKEYIQQTQEEDAKIRRLTSDPAAFSEVTRGEQRTRNNSLAVPSMPASPSQSTWLPPGGAGYLASPQSDFGLGLRPFSPIDLSLDEVNSGNRQAYPPANANAYSRQGYEI